MILKRGIRRLVEVLPLRRPASAESHKQKELKWDSLNEDPRPEVWDSWSGAVLLDDEIKYYASHPKYPLISPYCDDNLKPARYLLTVGSEARVGGKTIRIDKDNPLIIPPHQVAIVRTRETLNLPRFLTARWNITVDMVYRGLLWVGAGQVDPGWVGYLPCPLYNLSDDSVQISYCERAFTIDFVKTTQFVDGRNIKYPNKPITPPLNPGISYYDANHLRSGPYEMLKELSSIRDFRNFAVALFAVMFTAIAAIVTALSIIVVDPIAPDDGELLGRWALTALVFAGMAFLLSVLSIAFQLISVWRRLTRG